jgi:hypothetical protein
VYPHVLGPISYMCSYGEVVGMGFALGLFVGTCAGWNTMTSRNVYIKPYNNAHKAHKINIFIG